MANINQSEIKSILRMKQTITEKMDQDHAFYRKFSRMLKETSKAYSQERLDEAEYYDEVLRIEEIIEAKKIRDWVNNDVVQNEMMSEIEDYLHMFNSRNDLSMSLGQIDVIIDEVIITAIARDNL